MNNSGKVILIGGSAGSFQIVVDIIASMPRNFQNTIILCVHRLRNVRSGIIDILSANSPVRIKEPYDKEFIRNGIIYLSPPNYHLMIEMGNRFSLSVDEGVNHSRPSIDILFETAAEVYRERCTGILLSGANSDGAKGMVKLKAAGALTIVQDPSNAEIDVMPSSCLNLITPDYVLTADKIINFMRNLQA